MLFFARDCVCLKQQTIHKSKKTVQTGICKNSTALTVEMISSYAQLCMLGAQLHML